MTVTPLDSTDIAALQALINNDDFDGYWAYLEGKGFGYATLARGVVNDNTTAANIANKYAEIVADREGVDLSVNSTKWDQLIEEIAQADLALRDDNRDRELTYEEINEYHTNALSSVDAALGPEVWTMHVPLKYASDPDAMWSDAVTESGYSGEFWFESYGIANSVYSNGGEFNLETFEWFTAIYQSLFTIKSEPGNATFFSENPTLDDMADEGESLEFLLNEIAPEASEGEAADALLAWFDQHSLQVLNGIVEA